MAVQIVSTLTDATVPEYTQTTTLDGVDFQLTFSYNARDEHWYLTIRTAQNVEITGCEGIKLVQRGWPIRRVYDQNRPAGELFILSELTSEPGLEDLGATSFLCYIPIADLEDLFA
jgi:hypothetical protein